MSLKAAQVDPKTPAAIPITFDEDLVTRCFPHKFRRIGDPNGYLDEVGIEPILEFIYKGNLLIDVAQATDIPILRLRRWVENRGYFSLVEEAETQSADGYLAFARHAIRNAQTEFELRRAKELMKHAEFMAQNKNKQTYGGGVHKGATAPVHYEFIIGDAAAAPGVVKAVIEGESKRLASEHAANKPKTVLDFDQDFAPLKPVLIATRPVVATPDTPDIGPFYDDPLDQENEVLPEHYSEGVL